MDKRINELATGSIDETAFIAIDKAGYVETLKVPVSEFMAPSTSDPDLMKKSEYDVDNDGVVDHAALSDNSMAIDGKVIDNSGVFNDIPLRNSAGNIQTNEAVNDLDVVNLSQLNSVTDGINAAILIEKERNDDQYALLTDLGNEIDLKEDKTNKGASNGYAPLDSNSKVPLANMSDAILGGVHWKGLYDGSVISNSPDSSLNGLPLPASSSTNTGWYFISTASYTYSGKSYSTGDWIISNGVVWDKVDNSSGISTVFGRTGIITAQSGDYTTSQITESSNKNFQSDSQKVFNDATSSIQTQLNSKQDTLINTVNIKSVNGHSLLGSGDLTISGGGGTGTGELATTTITGSGIITLLAVTGESTRFLINGAITEIHGIDIANSLWIDGQVLYIKNYQFIDVFLPHHAAFTPNLPFYFQNVTGLLLQPQEVAAFQIDLTRGILSYIGQIPDVDKDYVDNGDQDTYNASKSYTDSGLALKENSANKGSANGYAGLDSSGKVPVVQLPNSIMEYKGTYNASTNTPTLVDGTGNTGDTYKTTVAGAGVNSLNFAVGDYAIYNGTTWEKAHTGGDAVNSVFGRAGIVAAASGDYNTGQVTETTNLYFTVSRVLATVLTGLSTATNAVISSSDTILGALGKLQAQITALVNKPVQITITTTTSITSATTDISGNAQNGMNVIIDNGTNVINYTINGALTASFMKLGTGAITFVQGSGRTLVQVDGTAIFNGAVGSTATIASIGTTDYLRISNA